MIHAPSRARIYLAAGITDMRKGIPGLTALVKAGLDKDPLSGDVFVFRGRSSDQIKALWFSGDGINLYIRRLERGKFCLLYTPPSPRDQRGSRMPSSA